MCPSARSSCKRSDNVVGATPISWASSDGVIGSRMQIIDRSA
jgi:hypothetical protein